MADSLEPSTPLVSPVVAVARFNRWRSIAAVSILVFIWWYLEFAYQFYVLQPSEISFALVRSLGFTGATLISASLLSSIIFKFFPRTAVHWRLRRYLGLAGFIAITFHVLAAMKVFYNFNLASEYYTWNPFENPIVFGTIAYPVLFVMGVTSSDWAMRSLGTKRWKFVHRFVYLAFAASIFHFILINPIGTLHTLPGQVLLTLVALTIAGQLYWFFRTAARKNFRSLGTLVGLAIILAVAVTAYLAYRYQLNLP